MYNQPGYGQPAFGQPAYGQPYYGQPGFIPPPPPPQGTIIIQSGQPKEATIVNMAQLGKISKCQMCHKETDNVMRTKFGSITFAWCCFLGLATAGTLIWVPFCVDSCKDTQVVCQSCGLVKTKIQANCC